MNKTTIVFLINDSVRAIKATYDSGASPELFKTLDQSIKVDDLIVVQSSTRHEMTVCKVTEVDVEIDLDSPALMKWAIQRVNVDALNDLLAQEDQAIAKVNSIEKRKKKEALRAAIFADEEDTISTLKLANHADDVVEQRDPNLAPPAAGAPYDF